MSVTGGAEHELPEANTLYPHVCEDAFSMHENSSVNKQSASEFDILFANNSDRKENAQGKATEDQLLFIIDRLSHCVSIICFIYALHALITCEWPTCHIN